MKKVIPLIFLIFFSFLAYEGIQRGVGTFSAPLPGLWLVIAGVGGMFTSLILLVKKEGKEFPQWNFQLLPCLHIIVMCILFLIFYSLFNVYAAFIAALGAGYFPLILKKRKKSGL